MSKQQLTIEHLAPYLPYGLKGNFEVSEVVPNAHHELRNKTLKIDNLEFFLKYAKPILRPLSDLTKEIEHNGEKFVPLKVLNEYMPLFGDVYEICIDHNSDVRLLANYHKGKDVIRGFDPKNMLMKWHFDVFGLIDKGLAINLNEVK